MADSVVRVKDLSNDSDAAPRLLQILDPQAPNAPAIVPIPDTYSEDEAKALYREGIEFLRELAAASPSATARSQAASKLAQFFAASVTRQKPKSRIVVSFIDPRLLRDDGEADGDFVA